MADTVLVVNAGSSSIKFSVYDVGGASSHLALSLKGQVDAIGTHPRLRARDASGRPLVDQTFPVSEVPDVGAAMERVAVWLRERFAGVVPAAVGHRVAHGGAARATRRAGADRRRPCRAAGDARRCATPPAVAAARWAGLASGRQPE